MNCSFRARRPAAPLFLLGCLAAVTAPAAQAQDTSFPFSMPWDDATPTVIDVSALNPAPLTEKQRVVARDGHFYDATGRRVRFLGVNFVFSTNFPDKDVAEKMAARLHKFGVNLVRLHHMDTLRAPNGIFPAEGKDTKTLDADQLDRLDYLVYQLKQHGIYVDLNLLVGRRIGAADGLPDTWALPNGARVVSWFDPAVIELQKQYARALIARTNPYTKLRYADDPVVALIEINNEDTILGPGRAEILKALAPTYRKTLDTAWNAFLKQKYGTTAKMMAAWNEGALPYSENMVAGGFAGNAEGWQLEAADGVAQVSYEDIPAGAGPAGAGPAGAGAAGRAAHLTLARAASPVAPVQLHCNGVSLKRGTVYRVQFWAKASAANRELNVNIRRNAAPWSSLGLVRNVQLGTAWAQYSFAFTAAADTDKTARLSFTLTQGSGELWLAGVALQSGNAVELPAGQSLEAGNVELALISATGQGADMSTFTMDVEARYVEQMRSFIKDTLGAKSMVTCSQGGWGSLGGMLRESRTDYVDMHAYWDHPTSFDAKNWSITNTPMVRETEGGTLATLAMNRVAGKPYTVSEYNHSAPNDYQAETLPMIAAFAAWQDWDGIFLFDYHSNRLTIAGANRIEKMMSIDTNPAKMAYLPAAARIFLGGGMLPAPGSSTFVVPRTAVPGLMAKYGGDLGNMYRDGAGLRGPDTLGARTAVRFTDEAGAPRLERGAEAAAPAAPALVWKGGKTGAAWFAATGPAARVFTGFPGPAGQQVDGLGVGSGDAFLALMLNTRDGKPVRDSASLVLTVGSKFENRNMGWNATRTSVGDKWGEGPVQTPGVQTTLTLETNAKSATVWALDATGARAAKATSSLAGGKLTIGVSPADKAVWYEIEAVQP